MFAGCLRVVAVVLILSVALLCARSDNISWNGDCAPYGAVYFTARGAAKVGSVLITGATCCRVIKTTRGLTSGLSCSDGRAVPTGPTQVFVNRIVPWAGYPIIAFWWLVVGCGLCTVCILVAVGVYPPLQRRIVSIHRSCVFTNELRNSPTPSPDHSTD